MKVTYVVFAVLAAVVLYAAYRFFVRKRTPPPPPAAPAPAPAPARNNKPGIPVDAIVRELDAAVDLVEQDQRDAESRLKEAMQEQEDAIAAIESARAVGDFAGYLKKREEKKKPWRKRDNIASSSSAPQTPPQPAPQPAPLPAPLPAPRPVPLPIPQPAQGVPRFPSPPGLQSQNSKSQPDLPAVKPPALNDANFVSLSKLGPLPLPPSGLQAGSKERNRYGGYGYL